MTQVRGLAEHLWSQLRCECRLVSHNNFAASSASANITRASFAIRADLSHRGPVGDCRLSPIKRRFCPRVTLIIYLASACFLPGIVNVARLRDINSAKASQYRPRRRHHGAHCWIVRRGGYAFKTEPAVVGPAQAVPCY